ncbi:MAG: hypothetical protein IJ262_01835 [Clostridia bacterium]|nr:hypothetical protein [Clostridia bacterium]
MKKFNTLSAVLSALILSFAFSVSASANSSWVWITQTRPYDVLPFVIVGTLVAETLLIDRAGKIEKAFKTFFFVLVGNILSFITPYIIYDNFSEPYSSAGYSLSEILARGPYYTVGTAFLFLTLIIEMPFVYFFLRKDSENRKKLMAAIAAANILTTLLTALTERILCQGRW